LNSPRERGKEGKCETIVNPHVSTKRLFSCLAVVYVANLEASFNLLRFEMEFIEPYTLLPPDPTPPGGESGGQRRGQGGGEGGGNGGMRNVSVFKSPLVGLNSTGFFNNVANDNGRQKLYSKMLKLLQNLRELEAIVSSKLFSHNILPGDSVVVMVVNSGEIDLFMNFA
jgi:hypothetical protein